MEEQNVNFSEGVEEQAAQQAAETEPAEASETAEVAEASEAPEEASPSEEAQGEEQAPPAEEQAEDPFLKYIRQAFSKEHIDEFMQKLTDDQKSFVYVFCSGFETAIGRHIVGVYDTDYIEGYHFTKEVLDSLRIIVKPVDVKDTDLKFTIVAQLV